MLNFKNLPTTTLVTIDRLPLYIHRAEFSIIDTYILDNGISEE